MPSKSRKLTTNEIRKIAKTRGMKTSFIEESIRSSRRRAGRPKGSRNKRGRRSGRSNKRSSRSRSSSRRSKRSGRSVGRPKGSRNKRSRSPSRSVKKSPKGTKRVTQNYKGKKNAINSFFDRIFIINLKDKTQRFNKVTKQFHKHGVKYMRFDAVDGRCKDNECRVKKKEFEDKYDIKISNKVKVPVASLVIGTMQILKEQVRNKWSHVLICEDDVVFDRSILKKFTEGIKDIPKTWDLLYLGCGNQCGHKGISYDKTSKNKYKTSLSIMSEDYDWHVKHKDDLRIPCDIEECDPVDGSKYLSYPMSPGGGWGYCYSLSGAKKFLKFIGKNIKDHVDQLLIKAVENGKMKAIAFDPPIIWHEGGSLRPDSDLPWDW